MEKAMKRFLYTACLLFLGSAGLRAAEPDAHPVRDTLRESLVITREAIYIPRPDPAPVRNTCALAAQTTARAIAFPFVTGYVVVADGFTTLQTWINEGR
jgi:hypothetical protein